MSNFSCSNYLKPNYTHKAIAYFLLHLNSTVLLVMMVQNIIGAKVLQSRIKQRPRYGYRNFFVSVKIVDLIFAAVSLIRDTIYMWREHNTKWQDILEIITPYFRFAEGYLLTFRSAIIVEIITYYILMKKWPYRGEKMSSKATTVSILLGLICTATIVGDLFSHSLEKCSKYF